jgi:hypothetical protein
MQFQGLKDSYIPESIEATKYEYGERHQAILNHIEAVREIWLINSVDPDEVPGEMDPKNTPNFIY